MVAIIVVLAGVYVWAANLAESNTDGNLDLYVFGGNDAPDRTLNLMDQATRALLL